jgi:hypothetical protein
MFGRVSLSFGSRPLLSKKVNQYWRFRMESKIEVLQTVMINYHPDLYKIVDALNRTLKRKDLMFGLALDPSDPKKAVFTIYRT